MQILLLMLVENMEAQLPLADELSSSEPDGTPMTEFALDAIWRGHWHPPLTTMWAIHPITAQSRPQQVRPIQARI